MKDCTCAIDYLMYAAENSLSPIAAKTASDKLHAIAPNPFPEGRARMEQNWYAGWKEHARKLIWC
jgi:hypothetical protein